MTSRIVVSHTQFLLYPENVYPKDAIPTAKSEYSLVGVLGGGGGAQLTVVIANQSTAVSWQRYD